MLVEVAETSRLDVTFIARDGQSESQMASLCGSLDACQKAYVVFPTKRLLDLWRDLCGHA